MKVKITCKCPGHHAHDTVTFYDKLDFTRANIIYKRLAFIETQDMNQRPAEVLAVLSEYGLIYGVESWTLLDADRKKLDVTPDEVRRQLLSHPDVWLLAEAADSLYSAVMISDLTKRVERSSQGSQTEELTSPTPPAMAGNTPRPLRRSSITNTPTASTEVTSQSLDGGSNILQKSESAA